MKYMGSKRSMLTNGLGKTIDASIGQAKRVFDLFSGSGVVSWYIAEKFNKEVIANDLQLYSKVIVESILNRVKSINDKYWIDNWIDCSRKILDQRIWKDIIKLQKELPELNPQLAASKAILLSAHKELGCITNAYGGYYLSPWQTGWIDSLRSTLPNDIHQRSVALAALIQATSICVAAPGHTAQAFKPNETAGKYLLEAWARDLPQIVKDRAVELSLRHAKHRGQVFQEDANILATEVQNGDLVFVDPPYSGVQYSRFYHVLETVARGYVSGVSGIGRYPPLSERPSSAYSSQSKSKSAFNELLKTLSERRATVIITFPAGKASNGLSGDQIIDLASRYFNIDEQKISSRFSTMGGDRKHREARQDTQELILKLTPN